MNGLTPRQFFVFIIESPGQRDIQANRCQGHAILRATELDCIPSVLHIAHSRSEFHYAIVEKLIEARHKFPGMKFLLHLGGHGSQTGIEFASGETVRWDELRGQMAAVNSYLDGQLVVCMSSCEGAYGREMAFQADGQQIAFDALVGCETPLTFGDTAVAYATFYHLFAKGFDIQNCVGSMGVAAGGMKFHLAFGDQIQSRYSTWLKQQPALTGGAQK